VAKYTGMKRKIELLAPGGDIDAIKAAIAAGADAIYCGLDRFNARNRAENITFSDLPGIIRLAHTNNCAVFLTLNVVIVESEIPALITLLNRLVNTQIDGLIVQDLGLLYILTRYYPTLHIHASTQLTTHNEGQIHFLSKMNVCRVNLSRELSIQEIHSLTETAHQNSLLTEVFVHGSYCLSFSGICYLSSFNSGNSGNRGRCSQPCRDQYLTTVAGKDYPLNLKDNSAFTDVQALADAGVDSVKIEGRIKKFHYVYTVVKAWRKQLQSLYGQEELCHDDEDLHRVFNRGFSNAFLKGAIDRDMFVDHPRDYSAVYLAETKDGATDENMEEAKRELYDLKTEIITDVRGRIEHLSSEKIPLQISVSGQAGTVLHVVVQTPERSFTVVSDSGLVELKGTKDGGQSLDYDILAKRLAQLNETEFTIESLETDGLCRGLFLPFKELSAIRKNIFRELHDSQEYVSPIDVPRIKRQGDQTPEPALSLLLSAEEDLYLCEGSSADTYFQIPDNLENCDSALTRIFMANRGLLPWFPSVLIGDSFHAAVEFLRKVKPQRVVTNNSGIAYECWQRGVPWIAGPYLNVANSFSLLCLKENFNCSGSFISNELKRVQIKAIKKPDDFKLYYSIYHPIALMTSRQCLFHQVIGCTKDRIDENCLHCCEKSAEITNLRKQTFLIEKTKGNYHTLYASTHYLNTDILREIPNFFSSFLVDLRRIQTETRVALDRAELVKLFESYLAGHPGSAEALEKSIQPSTKHQYVKGI